MYCVINPARRQHERVWQLVQQHCAALGNSPPTLLATTIDAPGGPQARQALNDGADLVIVAGGDGTVGQVANVIAHTGVPMGIVPIGTANIFHLNAIGRDKRIGQAVRTALMGVDMPVDTGIVRLHGEQGEAVNARFLVVVGVGRDALSLHGVSPRLKRTIGPGAYFAAGIPQLLRRPLPMQVHIDGAPLPHSAAWSVLVGNCSVVPGGLTVLPGASLHDGKLNLLHVAPGSVVGWLPVAWRGIRGTSRPVRGVGDHLVEEVTIIPEQPAAVQIDGDVWHDVHRIEVSVDAAALIIRGKDAQPHESAGNRERDSEIEAGMDGP